MMSVEHIVHENREAARRAAAENKTPFVFAEPSEVDPSKPLPIPYLGDYVPEGWERTAEHFVDTSGAGREDEPALTAAQFVRVVLDAMAEATDVVGWAVTSVGQFQAHVGEYHKER